MSRGALNHIALTVSNLAESEARFYRPVLGFLGYEKVDEIPFKMTLWYNSGGRVAPNLWQAEDALLPHKHSRYAPGFHHCAFAVVSRSDVDTLHELLSRETIRIPDALAEYPEYAPGYCAAYSEDGDGLKFEAVHMPIIPS